MNQMTPDVAALLDRALNRLTKWRTLFTGWQLGTRLKGDPESDAVRDHREVSILMRAELNAITQLLIKKGVFTEDEFGLQLAHECGHLEKGFEERFPGVKANDSGLVIDARFTETSKGWKP